MCTPSNEGRIKATNQATNCVLLTVCVTACVIICLTLFVYVILHLCCLYMKEESKEESVVLHSNLYNVK